MTGELTELTSLSRRNLYASTALTGLPVNAMDTAHAIQADVDMLLKSSEVIKNLTDTQPTLTLPSTTGSVQLTSQARLTMLLGQLTQVVSEASDVQMKSNLSALIVRNLAMKNNYVGLSDAVQVAIDDLADAVDKLGTASDKLAEASAQHVEAEKVLKELTDKLSQLRPEDSKYQETLLLKQQAEVNKEQTAGGLANAEDAYKSALFLSDTAANSANKAFEAITEAEKSYPASLIAPAETRSSTIGRYIELIATLLQVINESNIESIKMQSKLSKDVNQARLNEMQKQADEIEKKQQAANKLRKALSIFAAIVGAILAVVGVVAAIPSGGMTLAGGIGLGVALVSAAFVATDIALQFTIDFSPMGVAFDKINKGISYIVEYTLSQIVKGLALLCDASTEDADKAKEYCTQITSAILTTLVLMLPMIVAGVGLSQAASKGVNAAAQATQASVNAATTAAVKTATDVVQQTVNTVSKATKLAAVLVRSAEIARVVAMALNTVVAPTVNIVIGVNTKEAYDALAKLGINKDEIKILSGIGKNQTKQIQSASDISQELNKQICEVLSERAQAMQTGYRNVERLGIA